MNSKDFLKEGFVEDASDVHLDHEVQMAREECYHAAEHALALHKLLRNVSEQQGLEGWVSAKITLANEYLNTVREHLEYELLQGQVDDMDNMAIGLPVAENTEQGVAEGLSEMDNRTPSGDRREQRDNSPEEKAKRKKEFRDNLNKAGPDMRKKLRLPEPKEGVAEGLPGGLSKSDYTPGKTLKHTSTNCTTCHGRKSMYKLGGKLFADNKQGATKVKCPTCKGTGDKQGVSEGIFDTLKQKFLPNRTPMPKHGDIIGVNGREVKISYVPGGYIGFAWRDKNGQEQYEELYRGDYRDGAKLEQDIAAEIKHADNPGPMDPNVQAIINRKRAEDPVLDQIIRDREEREEPDFSTMRTSSTIHEQGVAEARFNQDGSPKGPPKAAVKFGKEQDRKTALHHFKQGMAKDDLSKFKDDKKKGVAEAAKCNQTMEGTKCPVHGLKECPGMKARALSEWKKEQRRLRTLESSGGTSAGAVAGVTNPGGKPKSQVGSLFGGTYKQPKKAKKA